MLSSNSLKSQLKSKPILCLFVSNTKRKEIQFEITMQYVIYMFILNSIYSYLINAPSKLKKKTKKSLYKQIKTKIINKTSNLHHNGALQFVSNLFIYLLDRKHTNVTHFKLKK